MKTEILSVHPFRRSARKRERELTDALYEKMGAERVAWLEENNVPAWAEGFRVRKAGLFQHAVEATSWTGH